ncbi:MAG: pyridoxal phosphate-dependent aminotransferase [Lachnospiraceae bacterium]|nr:pyridoxal phosphate-dependent aminotransferase [Lachnospiraceae bacterium]
MRYDFDAKTNRRNSNSLKWDVSGNELPMWVADMDFQTAPEIREAILQRAEHGIYGYTILPDEWYEAYQGWWQQYHGFRMEREWLIFCTGVVPAISSAVRKLTTPGENVLIQTPVYNIFFNSIVNNGRNVVESPLVYDDGKYFIDFDRLEKDLANPQTTMMILCNPHNPVGKIWEKETLERIGEVCARYHVVVLSDEIHCDLTAPGKGYTPFASVSETCRKISITAIAPTKAFNLAGLQTAAVVVPNEVLRHKMWRTLNTDEVAEPNAFAVDAAVAAFTKGKPWLDELREYLQENKELVRSFIEKELPQLSVVSLEVTYLLWIDCSKLTETSSEFADFLRKQTGLYLSKGKEYGGNGEQFVRMNIACPREVVQDGLERLKQGVRKYDSVCRDR